MNVDTSGRGTFDARFAGGVRITRGFVDTRDRPSVGMRGGNFRITFYGDVARGSSDRDFTFRITGSDRGNARGTARVQLNGDRNEVVSIDVDGDINGDQFKGTFRRN